MSQILRQSTQVVVRIGPAVAVGDGFTPVTTLALGSADEAELLKAAGAATVSLAGATFAAITGADGWYDLTLTTSHTDTIGTLEVVINDDSLILPIHARFQVVEEAAYDSFFAASAAPATAAGVSAVEADTQDIQARLPAVLVSGRIDASVGSYPGNTAQTGDAFARLGAPAGVSVSADIAAIEAQTDDIGVAGAGLTALGDVRLANLDAAVSSRAAPGDAMDLVADALDATALATSAAQEIADALLDRAAAVEGFTPREFLRLVAAVLVGKADGMGTATGHFRDVADLKDRVTVTQDADGNRTALVLDAT